jgi:hypothetical protein
MPAPSDFLERVMADPRHRAYWLLAHPRRLGAVLGACADGQQVFEQVLRAVYPIFFQEGSDMPRQQSARETGRPARPADALRDLPPELLADIPPELLGNAGAPQGGATFEEFMGAGSAADRISEAPAAFAEARADPIPFGAGAVAADVLIGLIRNVDWKKLQQIIEDAIKSKSSAESYKALLESSIATSSLKQQLIELLKAEGWDGFGADKKLLGIELRDILIRLQVVIKEAKQKADAGDKDEVKKKLELIKLGIEKAREVMKKLLA